MSVPSCLFSCAAALAALLTGRASVFLFPCCRDGNADFLGIGLSRTTAGQVICEYGYAGFLSFHGVRLLIFCRALAASLCCSASRSAIVSFGCVRYAWAGE